ncbi:hypothetical protein KJ972_02860 [Candidatus Micrarchaeota archaeon]|nr:hypothetical protein [Patescibacteria group bacterium]MBU1930422.1 hypothetical protein [Candidatus Micrarchaeota archaeon]
MNWKWILIGLALIGLPAFVSAAYNPYINNGYGRPYYTQFHSLPGIDRVGQVYYGGGSGVYNYAYSNGWESYNETIVRNPYGCIGCGHYYSGPYYSYRSPASFSYPTVSVYVPPIRVRSYGVNFVYYS